MYGLIGLCCLLSFNAEAQKKKHPVAKTGDNGGDCYPTMVTPDGTVYITYFVSLWFDPGGVGNLSSCDETFLVFRDADTGNIMTSTLMSSGTVEAFPIDSPPECDEDLYTLNFYVDLPVAVDCEYFGDRTTFTVELEIMGQDENGDFVPIDGSISAQDCLIDVFPACLLDFDDGNFGLTAYSEGLDICCEHSTLPFPPPSNGGVPGGFRPGDGGSWNPTKVPADQFAQSLSLGTLELTPNPFEDQLLLSIAVEQKGTAQIELFDLRGRQLYTQTVDASKGFNQLELDLSIIPHGTYFLRWTMDSKSMTKRVVKTTD